MGHTHRRVGRVILQGIDLSGADGTITLSQNWAVGDTRINHSYRLDSGDWRRSYHYVTYEITSRAELQRSASELFNRKKLERARQGIGDDEY